MASALSISLAFNLDFIQFSVYHNMYVNCYNLLTIYKQLFKLCVKYYSTIWRNISGVTSQMEF